MVKKSIKLDFILKEARVEDGVIIDENGAEIDIAAVARKLYGDGGEFKLTLSRATSEELEIDEIDEE